MGIFPNPRSAGVLAWISFSPPCIVVTCEAFAVSGVSAKQDPIPTESTCPMEHRARRHGRTSGHHWELCVRGTSGANHPSPVALHAPRHHLFLSVSQLHPNSSPLRCLLEQPCWWASKDLSCIPTCDLHRAPKDS